MITFKTVNSLSAMRSNIENASRLCASIKDSQTVSGQNEMLVMIERLCEATLKHCKALRDQNQEPNPEDFCECGHPYSNHEKPTGGLCCYRFEESICICQEFRGVKA